ncbi:selenocysteine-specific translation elongation factor [Luteitalea sp.]
MHLTIATAGHIDHGKSALVQALTGTNPDRLPEERARGISIELGFAHTVVDDVTLSFVDVPGHERFVRTMLAGIGGIDVVLLVVAADESVMPQTREHFDICRLLGVRRGVIALTRCDLADETMQAIAESEVQALVEGSFLEAAPVVRVSARTGAGIDALRAALVHCAASRGARDLDLPVRLPIDRVFSARGFGTVVTGTLWSGVIDVDRELTVWPSGARVRVRGVQVHGAAAARAEAGQRTAVNLAGVSLDDVARGDVLLGEGGTLSTRRLAVTADVLPGAPPQKHGTRVHVHLGTSVVLGRLLIPGRAPGEAPRTIPSGSSASALLRLESPLPARRGDRLVLRAYSPLATIAGALVADPWPPARTSQIRPAETDDAAALVFARVRDSGTLGCARADLPARCGLTPAAAAATLDALVREGRLVDIGPMSIATDVLPEVRTALLQRIDAAQTADPLAGGVPRAALRTAGGRRWRAEVADVVLAQLTREGVISGDDRIARAAAQAPARDPVDARVFEAIDAAGLGGRSVQELEAGAGVDRKALAAVLARLSRAGDVERLGDLSIASGHLRALVHELRRLADAGEAPARIEVGWFKERYGLTRRTAIPLLEWLDRTRVTRREGEARVLIPL